jgi:hypothetical protein
VARGRDQATPSGKFAIYGARAQYPPKVDPAHFKLEFENSQVKVVRVYFGPPYKLVMNQMPARVVVFPTGAHFRVTGLNRTSAERYLKAGTAFRDNGSGRRIAENLSNESFDLLCVVPRAHSKRTNR